MPKRPAPWVLALPQNFSIHNELYRPYLRRIRLGWLGGLRGDAEIRMDLLMDEIIWYICCYWWSVIEYCLYIAGVIFIWTWNYWSNKHVFLNTAFHCIYMISIHVGMGCCDEALKQKIYKSVSLSTYRAESLRLGTTCSNWWWARTTQLKFCDATDASNCWFVVGDMRLLTLMIPSTWQELTCQNEWIQDIIYMQLWFSTTKSTQFLNRWTFQQERSGPSFLFGKMHHEYHELGRIGWFSSPNHPFFRQLDFVRQIWPWSWVRRPEYTQHKS